MVLYSIVNEDSNHTLLGTTTKIMTIARDKEDIESLNNNSDAQDSGYARLLIHKTRQGGQQQEKGLPH